LWIGSDPFWTVLLFDWLGSNVNEGGGAKSNCDCKSSTATAFRPRAIWASGDCLWSHLRARSLLLRPETMPGWEAKIPTQTKTKNPLKVKKLISFAEENLEEQRPSEFEPKKRSETVFISPISWNKDNLAVYLLWDLEVWKQKHKKPRTCREVEDSPQS